MIKQRGWALLGALVGAVALICGTLFAAFGLLGTSAGAGASRAGAGVSVGTGPGTGSGSGSGSGTSTGRPVAPVPSDGWTGTWTTAPAGVEPEAPTGYPGSSIRNVVHTSIGGTEVRVTFSNIYSPTALLIGHASIAVRAGDGAGAAPGSMRRLMFERRAAVTVPPGGQIVSDPVALAVPYAGELLVTLYTPAAGGPVTYHPNALQTSYLADGDHTEDPAGDAYTRPTKAWRYLTAVDVLNHRTAGAVVAFGDSITDGVGSRTDANHRWPDILAARLRDQHIGVLNEGIGGNRVLADSVDLAKGESGIARFRRDALGRAGVRVVIVDLGVNDILRGAETDPARIVNGLRELTHQAHERGLRVIGATLTPFGGHRGHNATTESVRARVNAEIRAGRVFDDVVDFDLVVRDPDAPERLRPAYDSGDHLHPSDAGYLAMGDRLDLRILEKALNVPLTEPSTGPTGRPAEKALARRL
ncbi:GDSL-type esterase/lipase family protein [Streptomyces sp. NPDC087658]|uniref:GDSL-type esterase/lipase family protein n=1 Tax=Streptomyces sp. NPDC087658 TaxID=3365800 RepID=UPI0037FDFB5D